MPISPRDFTVGLEEEYQLVDARTGDLRSRARWVTAWAADETLVGVGLDRRSEQRLQETTVS